MGKGEENIRDYTEGRFQDDYCTPGLASKLFRLGQVKLVTKDKQDSLFMPTPPPFLLREQVGL